MLFFYLPFIMFGGLLASGGRRTPELARQPVTPRKNDLA